MDNERLQKEKVDIDSWLIKKCRQKWEVLFARLCTPQINVL